jgi:glycine cleavage system H protein
MSITIPDGLKYSDKHEWVKAQGNTATMGISAFAQDQLGDIVYLELPEIGKEVKAQEAIGVVESVKSVSSIYSPVSGKVVEINNEAVSAPQIVNQDPYEKGWMIKIEMANPDELNSLLSAQDYQKAIGG